MPRTIEHVDEFLSQQVENGNFGTVQEAEVAPQRELAKRQIDRAIEQGEDDISSGNYRVMSAESNQQFMQSLHSRIIGN